jgi:hypothetical protein
MLVSSPGYMPATRRQSSKVLGQEGLS